MVKRIFALFLTLFVTSAPAFADLAVGTGAVSAPSGVGVYTNGAARQPGVPGYLRTAPDGSVTVQPADSALDTSLLQRPSEYIENRSGAITTGGTSQYISPYRANRHGFVLQNVSSGDLWIDETGANAVIGAPSWKIPAGTTFMFPPGYVPLGDISAIGATTGQQFTEREW